MGKLNWYRYGKVQYVDLPNGVTYQLNAHNVLKCNVPGSSNVRSQATVANLEEAEQRIIAAAKKLYKIDLSEKEDQVCEFKKVTTTENSLQELSQTEKEKTENTSIESSEVVEEKVITPKRRVAKAVVEPINILFEEKDDNISIKIECNISDAKVRYSTTGKDVTNKNKLYISEDIITVKKDTLLKVAAFDSDNKIIATAEKQF